MLKIVTFTLMCFALAGCWAAKTGSKVNDVEFTASPEKPLLDVTFALDGGNSNGDDLSVAWPILNHGKVINADDENANLGPNPWLRSDIWGTITNKGAQPIDVKIATRAGLQGRIDYWYQTTTGVTGSGFMIPTVPLSSRIQSLRIGAFSSRRIEFHITADKAQLGEGMTAVADRLSLKLAEVYADLKPDERDGFKFDKMRRRIFFYFMSELRVDGTMQST